MANNLPILYFAKVSSFANILPISLAHMLNNILTTPPIFFYIQYVNYRPQSLSRYDDFIFSKIQTDVLCKHLDDTHSLPLVSTQQ